MKITLKSNIDSLLVTVNDNRSTDVIDLTPTTEALLGKTIEVVIYNKSILNPNDSPEVAEMKKLLAESTITFVYQKDGRNFPIHNSWVSKFEGKPISKSIDPTKPLILLTEQWYYKRETNELISSTDIKVCITCGGPLDDTHPTLCRDCFQVRYFNVKSSSHTPSPIFFGTQTGALAKTNPAWYGIELEYGLHTKLQMAKFVHNFEDEIYLKSDGSIRGGNYKTEMVSHPGSFTHLMSPYSWVSNLHTLDAEDSPLTNGCHIHISRTAFKDSKHYAKFKFLIQENNELLELIGGRPLTSYCDKKTAKKLIHRCDKDYTGGEKYSVVNETHKATIELRFMASSNNPDQVKRYLQFIDSMLKYTAYYHQSASYQAYFSYVTKYKDTYPLVHAILEANQSVIKGEVVYKAPTLVEINLNNMSQADILNTIKIKLIKYVPDIKDGTVTEINGNFDIVYNSNQGFIERAFGYRLAPNSIVTCIVAK